MKYRCHNGDSFSLVAFIVSISNYPQKNRSTYGVYFFSNLSYNLSGAKFRIKGNDDKRGMWDFWSVRYF